MARPLTGSRWERGRRFYASRARGPRIARRVEASFAAETERDAWLRAAVAAAEAGRRPPDPAAFRNRPPATTGNETPSGLSEETAVPSRDRPRPLFEALSYGWLDEYYGQLRNAEAERERDVRTMVENYLIPAFAGLVPGDAGVAHKRLIDFVRRLALEPEWEADEKTAPALPPLPALRRRTPAPSRGGSPWLPSRAPARPPRRPFPSTSTPFSGARCGSARQGRSRSCP